MSACGRQTRPAPLGVDVLEPMSVQGAGRLPQRRRALVIGGTQFLGRHSVRALLDAGYEVTLLSRGRTRSPFAGDARVTHVRCNRERDEFAEFLRGVPDEGFDATVDFCAYAPEHVRPIVDVLGARAGLYVFISTDSVYMACDPSRFVREHGGRLAESSATRPEDARERAARAARDEYGSLKLEVEEQLAHASARDGSFSWTALRLPDAFGPFENTGRQAALVRRLRRSSSIGLRIEGEVGAGARRPVSLVFGPDVGLAVVAACGAPSAVRGRALNICAREAPTWEAFVRALHAALTTEVTEVPEASAAAAAPAGAAPSPTPVPANTPRFAVERDTQFLSTDFGALSGALAGELLPHWRATVLEEAVRATAWFENHRATARGGSRKRSLTVTAMT